MFNQKKPAARDRNSVATPAQPSESANDSDVSTVKAPTSLEELMSWLDDAARSDAGSDTSALEQIASDASTHAETLHEALMAQKQAQRMLDMATKVRDDASTQGEQLLLEAQAAAVRLQRDADRHSDRARRETADWAAEQRAKIDRVVEEVVGSARQEAEEIRQDAIDNAVAEAEVVAQEHLRQVVAGGQHDADLIRAQARSLLERSASVAEEVNAWLRGFAVGMSSRLEEVHSHVGDIDALLGEADELAATTRSEETPDADTDNTATDPAPPDAGASAQAKATKPAAKTAKTAAKKPAKSTVAPTQRADDRSTETETEPDAGTPVKSPSGRPLGSQFRGPDQR